MIEPLTTFINNQNLAEPLESIGIIIKVIGIILVVIYGLLIKVEEKSDWLFKIGILALLSGIIMTSFSDYSIQSKVISITHDISFKLDNVIQILAIIVGFCGIVWQLNKQKEQNKANHKQNLKISIYKDIVERIENSSPEGTATTLWLLHGKMQENIDKHKNEGQDYQPPPFRLEEIHSGLQDVHSRLWRVCNALERTEVISEHFSLFRRILHYRIIELNDVYMRLVFFLPYVIPTENGIEDPKQCYMPSDDIMGKFEKVIREFHNHSSTITAYLSDIQVELQTTFLGPLFNRELPIRKPQDTNEIVLTSRDSIKLKQAQEHLAELDRIRDASMGKS